MAYAPGSTNKILHDCKRSYAKINTPDIVEEPCLYLILEIIIQATPIITKNHLMRSIIPIR